ncbi:MAG: M56 family metallopeptidase, partial [Lachnospiraceae bacterium]|nr:M56 family metallopeptidase [Lachnospiraceae bacterium]
MTGLLERSLLAAAMIAVLILVRALFLHRLPKFTFQAAWAVVILRLLIPYSAPIIPVDAPDGISWIISMFAGNSMEEADTGRLVPVGENGKTGDGNGIGQGGQNGNSDRENSNVWNDVSKQSDQKITSDKAPLSKGENIIKGWKDIGEPEEYGKNSGENDGLRPGTKDTDSLQTEKLRPIFLVVWLAGVLASSLYFLLSHLRARLLYSTALPVEYPLPKLNGTLERTLFCRRVKIKVSDRIFAPVTYGLFFPVIVLPKNTDWENERQLRMVLEHEAVHIRRLDILYKWLLVAVVALHWFNPLVLAMYFLANRDIELSCDEAVIQRFEDGRKKDYALALLNYEEKRMFSPTVTGFGVNAVKERMRAIMKLNKTSMFGVAMSVILVAGTTTVFAGAKENKNTPQQLLEGMGQNAVSDGRNTVKQYICEPAYYTPEEFEEAMEKERNEIMEELEKGTLDRMLAEQMLAEIEDMIREVKNGKQAEKPSPVYNADGTPLVNSKGSQLYAKASDIERMNSELREKAESMNRADMVDSVTENDILVEEKFVAGYMQEGLADNFILPETDQIWYSYEEYQKYAEKMKEEYRSMAGQWGFNSTEGWYEWDEEKIEEACRQLDENLEFIKNGGRISLPDADGGVLMTSFSKFDL